MGDAVLSETTPVLQVGATATPPYAGVLLLIYKENSSKVGPVDHQMHVRCEI